MPGRRKKKKAQAYVPPPPPTKGGTGAMFFYRYIPTRVGLRDLLSPVRQLETRAFARAIGGNRAFGGIFLGVVSLRALRDASKRKPQVLVNEKLKPGEGISVSTAKPPRGGLSAKERQRGLPS